MSCTLVMRVIDITSQTLAREQALGDCGLKENAYDFFFLSTLSKTSA